MERLTKRDPFDGMVDFAKPYYEPVAPLDVVSEALSKLAAYEDAEEQGRLVVLPCKVGDTVFVIERDDKWPRNYCVKISEPIKAFLVSADSYKLNIEAISEYWYGGECGCLQHPEGKYGRYYYTREEAEKALEGMG